MSNEMKTGPVWEPERGKSYWFSSTGGRVSIEPFREDMNLNRLYKESGRIFYDPDSAIHRLGQQGRWVPFAEAVKPEEVEANVAYFFATEQGAKSGAAPYTEFGEEYACRGCLFPFSPSGFLAAEAKSEELKLNSNQTEQ